MDFPMGDEDLQLSAAMRLEEARLDALEMRNLGYGILCDKDITTLAKRGMITPFVDHQRKDRGVSYGLSSFGYDIRMAGEYKICNSVDQAIIDPLNVTEHCFVEREGDSCIIPPHSFMLTRTVEQFKIPEDVLAICMGKSTLARMGLVVGITPLEPDWSGYLTIEISNTTPLPAKVYANMGVAQLLFLRGSKRPSVTYKDRGGRYMGQIGVVTSKPAGEEKI